MSNKLMKIFTKKEWTIVFSLFVVLMLISLYTFLTPNHYPSKTPITIEVKAGHSYSQFVSDLYKQKVISSRINFRAISLLSGLDRKLKLGRYTIPNDLSYVEIVKFFLTTKPDVPVSLYIIKGTNLDAVASNLSLSLALSYDKIIKLSFSEDFLAENKVNSSSLEGYLLPGKYEFYKSMKEEEILTEIVNRFHEFYNDSLLIKTRKAGMTINDVLTLASIVQGETHKVTEMDTIAGVYLNRVRTKMKLQADPTVQYALKRKNWGRLIGKDLKVDSPYNTYKYYGFPPGPINNPSKEAILAALNPVHHNYFYFVADGTGGHKFTQNYNLHLKTIRAVKIAKK